MTIRFNHMEITFPMGSLTPELYHDVTGFYGDVFGFTCTRQRMFCQQAITMRADRNDFLLLIEGDQPMTAPGFDHLGFELDSCEEVDATLEKVRKWQEKDPQVQLKEYDDAVMDDRLYRAYYVKHLLPIWFDVQFSEPVGGVTHRSTSLASGTDHATQECHPLQQEPFHGCDQRYADRRLE